METVSSGTAELMGALPKERTRSSVPFSSVGIDLAGPLIFKEQKSLQKCYVLVYRCFNSKFIHLDLVRSLNMQDCVKALRRFIARRGWSRKIFSDNGANFIGALGDLTKFKRLVRERHGEDFLPYAVMNLGINWAKIPARSPNFDGLWESAVKSMKLLLRKISGKYTSLKFEEMYTAVCQIEGFLSSPPITIPSDKAQISATDCG